MKKALKINTVYINMETIVAFDLNYKIDGNRVSNLFIFICFFSIHGICGIKYNILYTVNSV